MIMIKETTRVLCMDPHPLVGEWLRWRLGQAGLELTACSASPDEALALADRHEARVIVMEATAPGVDPLSIAGDLARRRQRLRIVFLSGSVRARLIWGALDAGASAYFGKADEPESIVAGIRAAARDLYAFGASVVAACPELRRLDGKPIRSLRPPEVERPSAIAELTLREQEVLRLLAQGYQRSDIANRIHRSPKTVDKHRAAVMRKLDIHDRAKLVLFAVREGLVAV
ncbi:MAG TPA: response regulator transcription factor [Phycisphaerales bacterium]|nr:response regulator transcription factor [Phycisphaerales bacterium]